MSLNGIDISSWQPDLVPSAMATTGFIIVKATEGTGYVNPCFDSHAAQALAAGKKLGCYHFATVGDAVAQADYFIGKVKEHLGKAVLALDWEAGAVAQGPAWAKRFMDRVKSKTGVTCLVYMSKSVCNAYDWSAVAKAGYGLWVAQYPDYSQTGYKSDPWTDSSKFGAWGDKWTVFQYTSSGRVKGYSGNLDLDRFRGSKADWDALCKASKVKAAVAKATTATSKADTSTGRLQKMVAKAKEIAADDSHGYSQYRRWPYQGTDFDCSSLMYYVADYAGYGVKMTDPRWTGSMAADFTAAGFKQMAFSKAVLAAGDILLSHNDSRQHTELYIGNGKTVGAHIAETGGIDGRPGDQTGNEISVSALSWTPQWILRPPDSGSKAATASTATSSASSKGTKYIITADVLNVRDRASTVTGSVVGQLRKGASVTVTDVKKNSAGNTWGKLASGTYSGKWIAVVFHGETYAVKSKSVKTVEQLAREVIAGKWGNGQSRIEKLRSAGYDAAKVQAKVNELLS